MYNIIEMYDLTLAEIKDWCEAVKVNSMQLKLTPF